MLDTPNYTAQQMSGLRRAFHAMNHFMLWMWKLGLGPLLNSWPAVGGRMLVIEHQGRRSGKRYLTPVNYAPVDGAVYCTAGLWTADRLVSQHHGQTKRAHLAAAGLAKRACHGRLKCHRNGFGWCGG